MCPRGLLRATTFDPRLASFTKYSHSERIIFIRVNSHILCWSDLLIRGFTAPNVDFHSQAPVPRTTPTKPLRRREDLHSIRISAAALITFSVIQVRRLLKIQLISHKQVEEERNNEVTDEVRMSHYIVIARGSLHIQTVAMKTRYRFYHIHENNSNK